MRPFEFRHAWTVPFPRAEVHDVLSDVEHYPEWWPQVRACLKTGPDDGVVLCRSSLPWTLELHLHATHRQPDLLETQVRGDLDGWVRWRLTEEPGGTRLDFEQEVTVRGATLTLASYAARPVLGWNHARMMAGAREGLDRRLDSATL